MCEIIKDANENVHTLILITLIEAALLVGRSRKCITTDT